MAIVTDELLEAARNYLDITWDDLATNAKLAGILARGMAYLDKIAGAEQNYYVEDFPRALLLDYARYARANALDEFTENFNTELNSLRMDSEANIALRNAEGGEHTG